MSTNPTRRPAPDDDDGAAAIFVREQLFGWTLGTGICFVAVGLLSEFLFSRNGLPLASVFGRTIRIPLLPVCWVAAVYPFVLATRAIWLPDHKLRTATRHLAAMGIGIGVVAGLTLILWTALGKLSTDSLTR